MKNIIFIGGTMGVGKSTVSQALKKDLNDSVCLDGDWCWDMNPFVVNGETNALVMDNILGLPLFLLLIYNSLLLFWFPFHCRH